MSQQLVNDLYGNQPPGFSFQQQFSIETLNITGGNAFGSGYSDPAGTGGNFALGLLSTINDDKLALTFSVGAFQFFNLRLDISGTDISCCGGPFVPNPGVTIPRFMFSLIDTPGGAFDFTLGTVLDSEIVAGVPSARNVFTWTQPLIPLDASASTDGNVTLVIDLLEGGYAAMDNFLIAASDTPGDVGSVPGGPSLPEPAILGLLAAGGVGWGLGSRRNLRRKAAPDRR